MTAPPEPDRSSPCTDENGHPTEWAPPRLAVATNGLSERLAQIQADYEVAEREDGDAHEECPQGIHGWRQQTPNGLCPWCEWEDAVQARAEVVARVEALAAEIEDPRTQRPGMQRRREWAKRLRRAASAGPNPHQDGDPK
jgi:hypothetical protein